MERLGYGADTGIALGVMDRSRLGERQLKPNDGPA